MPPDPPREQGPEGLATPTQINATPTSKTVENPEWCTIVILEEQCLYENESAFIVIVIVRIF